MSPLDQPHGPAPAPSTVPRPVPRPVPGGAPAADRRAGLAEAGRLALALVEEAEALARAAGAAMGARLPPGVSAAQWRVLDRLARAPDGATLLQVAQALRTTPEAATALVAGLEGRALVGRCGERGRRVRATEAGLGLRDRVGLDLAPELAALLGRFPAGRLAALLPELAALCRAVEEVGEG